MNNLNSCCNSVAIIGAGGQARVITEIFEMNNINIIGYISTEPEGTIINGYPILCNLDKYIKDYKEYNIDSIIISIGDNFIRKQMVNNLNAISPKYINAIHPCSIISSKAELGVGIIVNAGAIINPGTKIGNHSNIGTNSSIDHDCNISNFVNVSPSATLCGSVKVGEMSVIGANATIIEKISIGEGSLIAAGAVVVNDVVDNVITAGIPAKYKRDRKVGEKYLR